MYIYDKHQFIFLALLHFIMLYGFLYVLHYGLYIRYELTRRQFKTQQNFCETDYVFKVR